MQIVRTILWVVIFVLLLAFSYFNWRPVEVQIWDNLVLETKVPALVVLSFLLGLVPMWLVHRGSKWRLKRRVVALETAARTAAITPVAPPSPPPVAEPLASETSADTAPLPRGDVPG
jgi:hypothetical protein